MSRRAKLLGGGGCRRMGWYLLADLIKYFFLFPRNSQIDFSCRKIIMYQRNSQRDFLFLWNFFILFLWERMNFKYIGVVSFDFRRNPIQMSRRAAKLLFGGRVEGREELVGIGWQIYKNTFSFSKKLNLILHEGQIPCVKETLRNYFFLCETF